MWAVILLFLLGLTCGSFLNVVAARYREGEFLFSLKRLSGRSRCPRCHKTLRWYELIPLVSFVLQQGRCRHCDSKISSQYPIVETLSGVVFLLPVYFYYFFDIARHQAAGDLLVWYYWLSGGWVIAGLLMIVLATIDWRTYLIPDEASIGIAMLGLLIAALKWYYADLIGWQVSFLKEYALMGDFGFNIFTGHLVAGLVGLIFFGGLHVVTRGRGIGFGDVKLAAALGLLLGWPDAILAFGFAFVVGSLVSVTLIIAGRKKFKEAIPFGPYLVVGALLTITVGYAFTKGYFNLFGVF